MKVKEIVAVTPVQINSEISATDIEMASIFAPWSNSSFPHNE